MLFNIYIYKYIINKNYLYPLRCVGKTNKKKIYIQRGVVVRMSSKKRRILGTPTS